MSLFGTAPAAVHLIHLSLTGGFTAEIIDIEADGPLPVYEA